ncbi:MAG: hypothetical protein HYY06_16710 [Deltaproteobacteria bacterium]|nr:hypothetical protein [Deltaproteobacteria bacterium]
MSALTARGPSLRIEIARGKLVAVDTEGDTETFADFLVRTARVTGAGLADARRWAEDRGLSLWQALERKAGLDHSQIEDARRDLWAERICRALEAERFETGDPASEDGSDGRDLHEVLLRAVLLDGKRLDLVGYLVSQDDSLVAEAGFDAVASLLDANGFAGRTVRELFAMGEQTARATAALLVTGAARAQPAAAPPAPRDGAESDLQGGKGVGLVTASKSLDDGPAPQRAIARLSLVAGAASAPPPLAALEGPRYEAAPSSDADRLDDPVLPLEDQLALGADALDHAARGNLLAVKARLLWERFGAVEESTRAAREAAALVPASAPIIQAATSACMRSGDLANAAAYLRVELSLARTAGERAGVLRHLGSVLLRAGDHPSAAEALRLAADADPSDLATIAELAAISSAPEAADLWARIARSRSSGDDPEEALVAVRHALRLVPAHEAAIDAAVQILVPLGRIDEAERFLRDAIADASASGRAALYRRLAGLGAGASRPGLFAEACSQILLRLPDDEWARENLRAALAELGRTGEVAQLLRLDARCEDPDRRAHALEEELALWRAQLAAGSASDAERAVHAAARLLAHRPEHAAALETVRGHLEASRELGALCDILERSTLSSGWSSPEALATRLIEVGTLAEESLGAVHRALGAWERALQLVPGHVGAQEALVRLRGKARLQDGLLDLAEKEAADPAQRLGALRKIGGLAKDRPADRARAVAAFREILRLAPGDAAAVLALGRLYEGQDDAEGSAWLLGHRLETSPHRAERARIAARLAEVLHDDLGRLAEARTACLEALEAQPTGREVLHRLERIAVEAGDSSWLADALSRRAAVATGPERADLLITVAGLYEGTLADADRAIAAYRQVLEARPTDWRALRSLARLHAAREADLERAREAAQAFLATPAGRGDTKTLALLAGVRARLGDAAGERDALEALWALDPGDEARACELIERLLEGGEANRAADTIEVLFRGQADKAILRGLLVRAVAALEPGRAEALLARFLERVDPRDGAIARSAASSGRARGDHAAAARFLERALVGADAAERGDLSSQIAEEWDAAKDLAAATRCRVRLLRMAPTDARVLDLLEETYARAGDAARLIAILEVRLSATLERDQRHAIYAKLAAAARDLALDPDRALAYLGRSVREAPGEARALDAIQGMLLGLGRFEELAAHLEARAEEAEKPEERSLYLRQAAVVRHERLGDVLGAIRTARSAVQARPGDSDALGELERLAAKAGDHQTMAAVYAELAHRSPGAHGEKAIRYRAGRFLEGVGLSGQALDEYMRSFALDPQIGAALRAIERIATTTGKHEPVVQAYRMLADSAPDPGGRASALRKAAQNAEVGLGDREQALDLTLAAYASYGDPELELEMRRVAREIAGADPQAAPAAFQRLRAAFEKRAAGAIDAADRALWVRKLARVDEEDRGDPRGAFDQLAEACAASPEVTELPADLERLAAALDAWSELARLYERIIAESLEPELAAEYRMRLARIDGEHLGGSRAKDELRRVVSQGGPYAQEAFSRLRTRLEAEGSKAELVQLLESMLPGLAGEERIALTLEAARLLEGGLGDASGALALCEKTAAALDWTSRTEQAGELRKEMIRFAGAAGEVRKLDSLLDEELRVAEGPVAMDLALRLGELRETGLGDAARALAAYMKAVEIDPTRPEALDGAARTARATGDTEVLVQILELAARRSVGPERIDAVARQVAALREAGRRSEGTKLLEEALAGSFDETLASLSCEDLAASGKSGELRRLLDVRIAHAADPEKRTGLRLELARLSGPMEAKDDLAAILDHDPAHAGALTMLVDVEETLGNLRSAVHYAERAAAASTDRATSASLLCRAGAMLARASDEEGASRCYRAALEISPDDVTALGALAELEGRGRDLGARVGHLVRLAELDPDRRAAHLFAAAQSAWEAEDAGRALALVLECRALEAEAGPPAALHAMILEATDALDSPQACEAAEESLAPALGSADPASSALLRFVISSSRARRGDIDGAIALLEQGRAGLGPDEDDALSSLGLADCLSRRGEMSAALRHYEVALRHPTWHRLRSAADVMLGAGLAAATVGEVVRARELLSGAATLEPALQARVHRALADLALRSGERDDALRELRLLSDVLVGADRGAVLRELGELLATSGADDAAATACLEESLTALAPGSAEAGRALESLIEIALRCEDWNDVLPLVDRALARLAGTAAPPAAILDLHLVGARAAAALGDAVRELGHLQAARAADPESDEAATALERALAARGDYRALAGDIEARMRSKAGAPRASLLVRLGDVLRSGLGDPAGARAVYEEAVGLGSADAQARLATLLEAQPDRAFDAIAMYRKVVAADPSNVRALRSLRSLFDEIGATHESGGISSLLGLFDPTAETAPPPPLDEIKEPPEGVLAALTPPGVAAANEVLALVWDTALHLFRADLADFGIRGKDRVSPLEDTPLARTFAAAIRLLGLPRTGLFVRHGKGIEIVATHPPSLVVGADLGALGAMDRFRIGRAVEATRPANILLMTMPSVRARDLVDAIRAAFGPADAMTAGRLSKDAKTLAGELWKTIPPRSQRQLQDLVGRHPEIRDFDQISTLARRSVARAGLVVCGDAAAATRVVCSEDPRLSDIAIDGPEGFAQAVKKSTDLQDLVAFAVSDGYLGLRWRAQSSGSQSGARVR